MGKEQAGKEIAVRESFLPTVERAEEMREIVEANLGGSQIRAFDLERVKVPGSGGKFWEITDEDGTPKAVPSFEAIILHHSSCRQYYASNEINGQPPDCYSDDMIRGNGKPGGDCASCPFNQWGSGKNGEGKACAEKKKMFLLLSGKVMPAFLMVPTGSLKPVQGYFLRTLTTRQIPFYGALTTFGLSQEKSKDGIDYSAVQPRLARVLEPDEKAQVQMFRESFKPLFQNVSAAQPEPWAREPGQEG